LTTVILGLQNIVGSNAMSKRILSVSYDVSLLATRRMLLEQRGYQVTTALGFTEAIKHCRASGFDLFILGHSIPQTDKLELIETFRANCPAPILSLERHGEHFVPCDYHATPDDPEKLMQVVEDIFAGRERRTRLRLA
jgi:DNA-binding NtrC family response regulator